MGLVQLPILPANHFENVCGRSDMIDRTVLRMLPQERALRAFAHEPVDQFGKGDGPVAAQICAPLLGGDQQELGVRQLSAHAVVGFELLEPHIGDGFRVAVTVEIGGRLQHRFPCPGAPA